MKRGIITNTGHGIHISDGEVWMNVWEIADLFYPTVGSINSRLKAILTDNVLKKYDICQCIKLENGNSADVYNLCLLYTSIHVPLKAPIINRIMIAVATPEMLLVMASS